MKTLRAIVPMLLLAACGGDDGDKTADAAVDTQQQQPDAPETPDAPTSSTYDFSCAGNAAPTTANANVTVSGVATVVSVQGFTPTFTALADATVTACDATAANCSGPANDGSTTSDAQGAWSIGPIATGGTPLDEYVSLVKSGVRTTYVYPAAPLTADQANIPALTFDASGEQALNFAQCTTDQSIIGLAVTDCAGMPITDTSNINLVVKQGGTAITPTKVQDLGQLNAQAAGTFLVCGVPANAATEVSGTYKSMALRAHNVKTVAGTTTATILAPGF